MATTENAKTVIDHTDCKFFHNCDKCFNRVIHSLQQQHMATKCLDNHSRKFFFFSSSVQAHLSSKFLSFMYMPSFYYPSLILSIAIANSFHFFATTNFLEIEIFECPRETLKSLYSVLYA